MGYKGHVRNGVIVLDDGVRLPDGTVVEVRVVREPDPEEDREVPTLNERLEHFIGVVKNAPPDASINLDTYLYGVVRVTERLIRSVTGGPVRRGLRSHPPVLSRISHQLSVAAI